eukprot:10735286-Alexandrium_andersonii.AAC.1
MYLQDGFSDDRLRFDPIWDGENGDKRPADSEIQLHARRSIFTSQWELFKRIEEEIKQGRMEAMFSGSKALDARLNLVDWEDPVPREVTREMMGLGKVYNILPKSGYETTFN